MYNDNYRDLNVLDKLSATFATPYLNWSSDDSKQIFKQPLDAMGDKN